MASAEVILWVNLAVSSWMEAMLLLLCGLCGLCGVRDIPYIIGAVNGSHVPIIAPMIEPASYYCRNRFLLGFVARCHGCKMLVLGF